MRELCMYQIRLFMRSPRALIAAAGTPLVLMALLAAISDQRAEPGYHGRLLVSMATLGLASTCYTTLAASLVASRDAGVVKRLRATPLPLWRQVSGRVMAAVLVAVAQTALLAVVGLLAYGATIPWRAVPGLLLGALTLSLIGVAAAQVVPRGEAAATLLSTTLLPVVLISGIFFPVGELPGWVAAVATVSPLTHVGPPSFRVQDAAWLLAWALVALLFALWRFRVEPPPPRERRQARLVRWRADY